MRRIVTGFDGQGRSCVTSDDEISGPGPWTVWEVRPEDSAPYLARVDIATVPKAVQPPENGTKCLVAFIRPKAEIMAEGGDKRPGFRSDGHHATRTIDYIYVLNGEVHLDLDAGSILVRAGDVVIQRATPHSWRNLGTEPVALLGVLTTS